MVVDTSALVAILTGEADACALLERLKLARRIVLCAANRTELLLVMQARFGSVGADRAKQFLALEEIQTQPLDEKLADGAAMAYRRFGKGRHPAGLNFGDCFSYALAEHAGAPLLFKGDDFSRTDIRSALAEDFS
ncbi:type II toxin-antitoxin system VapC family toxin [Thiorhodovibrio frisius]|uniref:type II toxin-antitoxin system VapC family toxin n=1 Tax=Thiorhodovibrio frisius TaxID=631362 RepID=UPI000593E689|nr:type II toxin-antitoxin system VapC family toxin [Thiorhodovibrio frisius]